MKEQYIRTENLMLAASLKSHNYQVDVRMVSPTQAVFLIPKTPTTEELETQFWDNKLPVNPIAFTNAKFELVRIINRLKEEKING